MVTEKYEKYGKDKCKCGNSKHKQAKKCWECHSKNKRGQISRSIFIKRTKTEKQIENIC